MGESFVSREKRSGPTSTYSTCVRWRQPISPPGAAVFYAQGNYLATVNDLHTMGYDIPHFHARRRKGELLPITPFWQFRQNGSTSSVYDMYYGQTGSGENRYYTLSGSFNYYSDWVVSQSDVELQLPPLDQKYVQAAAAAIYSSGHDTLTFLAELTSVAKLFSSTAKKLLRLQIPKNPKQLAGEWLSARYGWRTLAYDISSLNEAIQNLNEKKTRYSQRKGTTSRTVNTRTWTTPASPSVVNHIAVDTIETGVRGCVIADIEVPQFQFNPLTTAWELIPYSFVVDWFVTVGKAISAANFLMTQSQHFGSIGHFAQVDRTYRCEHVDKTTSPWAYGDWYQDGTCVSRIERRIPCSVPLTPHFAVNLNAFKVLDLVGLIIQRH